MNNDNSQNDETSGGSNAAATLLTAFREVRHLAGGLVHHPVESTKHYSILRHSLGLVYYTGPSTSLAITLFSSPDHPLPPHRTFWLQPKGWLGKTGWRAKSLIGLEGDWLNVTPATQASSEQLNPNDERAWQRDIKHFLHKGASGSSRRHIVRETDIIRIPVEATDGYFRVVLCTGPAGKRKTLCTSPEFRVASTSASLSSIKGTSLGTLPLELGAKALSTFTSGQIGVVTAPVTDMVQPYVQQVQPGFVAQEAITEGYNRSGLDSRITQAGDAYNAARDASYDVIAAPMITDAQLDPSVAIGPQAPYPTHLSSQIVPGTGYSTVTTSLPTANLKSLRDDLVHRLNGYYFGWARIIGSSTDGSPSKLLRQEQTMPIIPQTQSFSHAVDTNWHESILSVLPKQHKSISVVHGILKTASVHLIHDFGRSGHLIGLPVEMYILGFLHPPLELPAETHNGNPNLASQTRELEQIKETAPLAAVDDVGVAQTSLSRPGWAISDLLDAHTGKLIAPSQRAPQTLTATQGLIVAQQQQQQQSPNIATFTAGLNQGINDMTDNMTNEYVSVRQGIQRQIDKVPFHMAGIRVGVDGLRDKSIGRGGVFVVRG